MISRTSGSVGKAPVWRDLHLGFCVIVLASKEQERLQLWAPCEHGAPSGGTESFDPQQPTTAPGVTQTGLTEAPLHGSTVAAALGFPKPPGVGGGILPRLVRPPHMDTPFT